MKKTAYMVVGCPGSGKSWVCDQLKDKYHYINHDAYIGMAGDKYVREIIKQSGLANKHILIETPFSMSKIREPLEKQGFKVVPVFIQEDHGTIQNRYEKRENKPIPQGHLTRQNTYLDRAKEGSHFFGTTNQVLEYLNNVNEKPEPASTE